MNILRSSMFYFHYSIRTYTLYLTKNILFRNVALELVIEKDVEEYQQYVANNLWSTEIMNNLLKL